MKRKMIINILLILLALLIAFIMTTTLFYCFGRIATGPVGIEAVLLGFFFLAVNIALAVVLIVLIFKCKSWGTLTLGWLVSILLCALITSPPYIEVYSKDRKERLYSKLMSLVADKDSKLEDVYRAYAKWYGSENQNDNIIIANYALTECNVNLLKQLLAIGVNVTETSYHLYHSIEDANRKISQWEEWGEIDKSEMIRERLKETVIFLFDNGYKPTNNDFSLAIQHEFFYIADLCVQHGIAPTEVLLEEEKFPMSNEFITCLINDYGADVNGVNKDGKTVLEIVQEKISNTTNEYDLQKYNEMLEIILYTGAKSK